MRAILLLPLLLTLVSGSVTHESGHLRDEHGSTEASKVWVQQKKAEQTQV
ncbi:MAG: hypothetical protein HOY78_20665 [Saccharothrix sp.]|nr:hypothetical protein [Saccharothrix sp.]